LTALGVGIGTAPVQRPIRWRSDNSRAPRRRLRSADELL